MGAAVSRLAQGLVLLLLGGAVLRISAFTTEYLNYVKPGFRPFLIAAGAVVFALGVITLVQEWRRPQDTGREPSRWTEAADGRGGHAGGRPDGREDGHAGEHGGGHAAGPTGGHAGGYGDGHGHDHSRGPRVAWLMCLPVCAIFLVAPPALGSFAAARDDVAPPPPPREVAEGYEPLRGDGPIAMPIGEFVGRAWGDAKRSLAGKQVRLTGFVVRSKQPDVWYVARMQLNCCAADAFALKVAVRGAPAPPENTWVEVTGVWIPPRSDKLPLGTVPPRIRAINVTKVPRPVEPYE
nr:MAG: TIGR03943 family protein [Actinomycetota bacterium]